MNALMRGIVLLLAAVTLVSCGGGGSGGYEKPNPTMELTATPSSVPLNTWNTLGGPSQTIIRAFVKDSSGSPVTNGEGGPAVQFSVVQPELAALYTMEYLDGADEDKDPDAFWSYPIQPAAGVAQIRLQAGATAGTVTVNASYTDAQGGSVSRSINVTIGAAVSDGKPAVIVATDPSNDVATAGTGAVDTAVLTFWVLDGAQQNVPNPSANNLRLKIVSGPGSGEKLQGINAAGVSVEGGIIDVPTVDGLAQVVFRAGTNPGVVEIQATSDQDNNVDNGIANQIIDTVSVTVKDSRVSSLDFTGDFMKAVLAGYEVIGQDSNGNDVKYNDGVYWRLVSVVATTADGQPVPAGTPIQFALVDAPLAGYPEEGPGHFVIAGVGNPEEGGLGFAATDGVFRQEGVIAQRDRLVLDGKNDASANLQNDLHTGSWIIGSVVSDKQLRVTQPFNQGQYDTGATVPYVVGRARHATIMSPAYTDETGTASTWLTYPMSRVGQQAILIARAPNGVSAVANTGKATYLPSVTADGYLKLTGSPTEITAGTSTEMTLCVRDGSNMPVPAMTIPWKVQSLMPDGKTMDWVDADITINNGQPIITGDNGCKTFAVFPRVHPNTLAFRIVFGDPAVFGPYLGGLFVVNVINPASEYTVLAELSTGGQIAQCNSGTRENSDYNVKLRVLDVFGKPVAGVYMQAIVSVANEDVTGSVAFERDPPLTDNNGEINIAVNVKELVADPGSETINITFAVLGDPSEQTYQFAACQ